MILRYQFIRRQNISTLSLQKILLLMQPRQKTKKKTTRYNSPSERIYCFRHTDYHRHSYLLNNASSLTMTNFTYRQDFYAKSLFRHRDKPFFLRQICAQGRTSFPATNFAKLRIFFRRPVLHKYTTLFDGLFCQYGDLSLTAYTA